MSLKERYIELVTEEFAGAQTARQQGNEGRARVCARRAAGFAIAWLLTSRGQRVRDTDALNLLKNLDADESIPLGVREAAKRLMTKLNSNFTYAFSTDPLDDAHIVVDYVKGYLA